MKADTATAQPAAATGGRVAAMRFIMITVVLDMIAIGLIIPVLPALVGTFTQSQTEQAEAYRLVMLAFGVANFLCSPILGALSDRYGRRPVLLIGMTGLSISLFTTALATALWMLVAVRLVSGAMQANIAVANAYAADVSTAENRAKHFGMLGAMFGVGFMLGPILGGVLGAIDIHLPFFVAGGLTVLNGLYGYFVLPESLPKERRSPLSWSKASPFTSFKALNRLEGMGPLVLILALSGLAQFTLNTTWVLYTQMKFGWGPLENGVSLFAVGLMSVIVQGGLMGRFTAAFGARRLAIAGLLSSSLCFLGWGLAWEGWMMFVIVALNVLGFTAQPAMQSLISNSAAPHVQGQTMGAVAAVNSLMAAVAPVVGPSMLVWVGHLPQGDWRIGAPYYLCSALQLVAAILVWRHVRQTMMHTTTAATSRSSAHGGSGAHAHDPVDSSVSAPTR